MPQRTKLASPTILLYSSVLKRVGEVLSWAAAIDKQPGQLASCAVH